MNKLWKSAKVKLAVIGLLVAMLVMSLSPINITSNQINYSLGYVRVVLASGTIDQPLTQVGIQAALNALPATGGKVNIMNGSSATLNFTSTVTRVIDNVIIQGSGAALLIQNDGITALFSAGAQTGWVFRDIRTDAGGITLSTDTIRDHVLVGTQWYEMPTGRGVTYVIAASNSTTLEKSQADLVSNTILQATFDALPMGSVIQLMESASGYNISNLTITNGKTLRGYSGPAYFSLSANSSVVNVTGNITLTRGGRLQNVQIMVASNFANDAVTVKGGIDGYYWGVDKILDNISLYNPTKTGRGVVLSTLATTQHSSIAVSTFGDIYIDGFDYGMMLESSRTGSWLAYINNNSFGRILTVNSNHGLTMTGGLATGNEIAYNKFTDVTVQAVGVGVYIEGKRNTFISLRGADNVGGVIELELPAGAHYNAFLKVDLDNTTSIDTSNIGIYMNGVITTLVGYPASGTIMRNEIGTTSYSPFTLNAGILGGDVNGNGKQITGLDRSRYNETNLVANSSFEIDNPPASWLNGCTGASSENRSATQAKFGSNSVRIIRSGGGDAIVYQGIGTDGSLSGLKVSIGAWVFATVGSRARIAFGGAAQSAFHTGSGTWEWITLTWINTEPAVFYPRLEIVGGDTTAYFDGVIVVVGNSVPAYAPRPLTD